MKEPTDKEYVDYITCNVIDILFLFLFGFHLSICGTTWRTACIFQYAIYQVYIPQFVQFTFYLVS